MPTLCAVAVLIALACKKPSYSNKSAEVVLVGETLGLFLMFKMAWHRKKDFVVAQSCITQHWFVQHLATWLTSRVSIDAVDVGLVWKCFFSFVGKILVIQQILMNDDRCWGKVWLREYIFNPWSIQRHKVNKLAFWRWFMKHLSNTAKNSVCTGGARVRVRVRVRVCCPEASALSHTSASTWSRGRESNWWRTQVTHTVSELKGQHSKK